MLPSLCNSHEITYQALPFNILQMVKRKSWRGLQGMRLHTYCGAVTSVLDVVATCYTSLLLPFFCVNTGISRMETVKNKVSSSSSSSGMQSVSVGFIGTCICRWTNMGSPILRDEWIAEIMEVGNQDFFWGGGRLVAILYVVGWEKGPYHATHYFFLFFKLSPFQGHKSVCNCLI